MNKILKIVFFIFLSNTVLAQNSYKVAKDDSGNFKSVTEVNNANLKSGDIVSFKSGQQFADAVLICKEGVTYNTYGGTEKAILGIPTGNFDPTVKIDYKNVTLSNLKIYGYKNAENVIAFSEKNLSVTDCEILGGENAHSQPTMGIRQTKVDAGNGHKFLRNKIHDLGWGIHISRPFNTEIAYNKMYDFWIKDGKMDHGGYAMTFSTNGLSDTWDAKYTLHIHHNNIFNFEYSAFAAGVSRMLIENNEIHHNLDERIFRGGVKHGGIGKIFDNSRVSTGGLGTIFRYNYVHDLIRRGKANFTYGIPSNNDLKNGTPNIVSTNNGTGRAVYLNAVKDNENNFGENFGDESGESPDAIISGLGYSNMWIHNNIFENCSNRFFTRTSIKNQPFKKQFGTYILNNTLINVGFLDYITNNAGLINTEWKMFSNFTIVNNIFDFTNTNSLAAIYIKGNDGNDYGKVSYDNNIYTKQKGVVKNPPKQGDKIAVWDRDGKGNLLQGNSEQYLTNPDWNNIDGSYFASNIGPKGTNIPDVRLKKGGNANNTGRDYNLLGDTFSDPLGSHKLGEDPTGRSFAYDILGKLRTTNDIGAVGTVDGGGNNTPPEAHTPVITIQPSNVSATIGSEISFSVTATCEDPIGYQWWRSPYISETESKIVNNSKYSGAQSNTLIINSVELTDSNINYVCEVYNTKDQSNLWVNSEPVKITIKSSSSNTNFNGLRVLLDASYKNNSLSLELNKAGIIPLEQPYNTSPWNYNEPIKLDLIKENYVDWLLVELRNNLTDTKYRKAGIITNDGKVLNHDGSAFSFENIDNGQYYLVINHRNHLSIMSSVKVPVISGKSIIYNFTASRESAYGDNSLVQLEDGSYGMIAGDADANSTINNLDFGIVANNIPQKGYLLGDLDMNGVINVLDYSLINKNILKSTNVPNK